MSRQIVVHSATKRFVQVAGAAVLIAFALTGLKRASIWWHASEAGVADVPQPLSTDTTSTLRLIVGQSSVIDGDTLEIHGERIRLEGIDAPESSQRCGGVSTKWSCGQQAALALSDWLGDRAVSCSPAGRDRYQRTLARCFVGNEDVQAWLVLNGWALAYRTFSSDYVAAEEVAQARHAGIWRDEFEPPWEWRKINRR